jgi:sortase A
VKQVVVQGTATEDLKKGPGHYPTTGLPGQSRAIAIAGHRTTWARPSFTSTASGAATG